MKIVLVTGATSGIGYAIASYLASHNYKVFGAGRNIDKVKHITSISWLYMDITNSETVENTVSSIINSENKIDILINCAGVGSIAAIETVPEQITREVFEINFFGTLSLCQSVIKHMRKQNNGAIINVSSIGGLIGLPFQGIYSASKYAIEGLSEALSAELKSFDIKVIIIEPGDFSTDIYKWRRVEKATSENPYYNQLNYISEIATQSVINGSNPEKIGKFVYNLLKKKNPQLRYKIASFSQKISPFIKKFLSSRLFEKIIMKYYKL